MLTRISGKSQYVIISALLVLMAGGTLVTTVNADDQSVRDDSTHDHDTNDHGTHNSHDDGTHDHDTDDNAMRNYNIIIKVRDAATHKPVAGIRCIWQVYPSFGLSWGDTNSRGVIGITDVGDTSIAINCEVAGVTVGTANVPINPHGHTLIKIMIT